MPPMKKVLGTEAAAVGVAKTKTEAGVPASQIDISSCLRSLSRDQGTFVRPGITVTQLTLWSFVCSLSSMSTVIFAKSKSAENPHSSTASEGSRELGQLSAMAWRAGSTA